MARSQLAHAGEERLDVRHRRTLQVQPSGRLRPGDVQLAAGRTEESPKIGPEDLRTSHHPVHINDAEVFDDEATPVRQVLVAGPLDVVLKLQDLPMLGLVAIPDQRWGIGRGD